MTARAPSALKRFVVRWEMAVYVIALLFFAGSLVAVVFLFPDVSNTWVSIFIIVGSFFSALAATISAIKTRE
jgi:hypothetical protein